MTLTEQHRSGKLERNRDYFVKVNDKVVSIYLDGDNDFIYYGHIIKPEVLAAVPTYEEYLALLSDSLAKNEGVEINAELKAENKKLKQCLKIYADRNNWDNIYDDESPSFEPLWRKRKWKSDFGYKEAEEALKKIKG